MPTESAQGRLRVALVHHWLVKMRGAEKVLEQFCLLFPDADIYTLVADRAQLSDVINAHPIHTTFLQSWPRATRWYRHYLPFMPRAFRGLQALDYDLVLTSDAGLAKGVTVGPGVLHVCYCHSPPRYLWNMYGQYLRDECRNPLKKLAFKATAGYLRKADRAAAQNVRHFLCNSGTVRERIREFYGRDATVIHPPVDLARFRPAQERGDYFLVVSQLNAYKRVDLAVRALGLLGLPLVVVGDGPERKRLEAMAAGNVEFRGFVPNEALRDYYAGCRAFIFPGEEDFGITPLEAHACGRPVIALRKGGVTESVIEGETGVFFDAPDAAALAEAVQRFERVEGCFDSARIRRRAEEFSEESFREKVGGFLAQCLAERPAAG